MDGSGVRPDAYEAYVTHANERDGWPGWRVADASTDRETGAPLEPVRDPTPLTPEEERDFLPLVRAKTDGTIDEAGRARLKEILDAHRFERMAPGAMDLVRSIGGRSSDPGPEGDAA